MHHPHLPRSSSLTRALIGILLLLLCAGEPTLRAQEIVADGSRAFLNLGGQWDVLPVESLVFNFPPPAGGAWKKEPVPGGSPSLRPDDNPYGGGIAEYLNKEKTALKNPTGNAAWFKRSFDLPANFPAGQKARLSFKGVAYKSQVWLNGKSLGGSMLGQVPASYDVTGLLHAGSNEVVVGVTGRNGIVDVANQTFLAPNWGASAGIWGKVELQFLPQADLEKIFINTSVKEKKIGLDVVVTNSGAEAKTLALAAVIVDSKQTPQTRIAGPEFTLAPGETKRLTLAKDWIAPNLWSTVNPALYFAKVSLLAGGATVDAQTVRFGFREFEIRGTDFYLNGVKTTLLRNSCLNALGAPQGSSFARQRALVGQPYNCIRLHGGFNSEDLLDTCDELGIMAIPEGAWHQADTKFNNDKTELWLPNVQAYYTKLVEQNYNRPSIVMWSITNETYWGKTDEQRMKIAESLLATFKAVDPIRPAVGDAEVTWGGRLPVINIHYPESSTENTLRAKYPNSGFVFPNDFYWLKKGEENGSWNAQFKWDRPLVIGEYWYPSGGADPKSAFMGEQVYDWEKWRLERIDGRSERDLPGNEFVRSQKTLTDAYRIQGAAGVNPWASDGQVVMPQVAVRPVDFHSNFFGGAVGTRKFAVLNDSPRGFGAALQCRLIGEDGQTLWEAKLPVGVDAGEKKVVEVKIDCPAVTRALKATLNVRLCTENGGGRETLDRLQETVYVMPHASLADVKTANIRLLDANGATAKALGFLGLKLEALTKLTSADLKGVKVVIVGEGTDTAPFKDTLVEFAAKGGSVVVLRQDQWVPLAAELPAIDKEHVSTRSWKRTFNHPITAGLDDAQFSYWRPDHLVSLKTFRKPASGNFRALLDCGGLFGLNWSPLIEVPLGRGTFVLTSLDLIGRLDAEPAAGQLIDGMIRYAGNFKPTPVAPLRLLAGADARPLRATLKAAGVVVEEGLKGPGPILLDSSFQPTPAQLGEIQGYLAKGGNVWLHGFSSADIDKVAALFPFKPELKPRDATVQSAVRRSQDPWINNLSSQDFFWTKIDFEGGADYFSGAHPTAPLGGEVLQLPTVQSGVRLIEPALLVKVPSGKGNLLFDALTWEKALGSETDKATRIASSLASSLGAETRSTVDKTQYDYFAVNLKPYANMGYYDRVANDGQGGWTDDGQSDMRFFLINHVGKSGGVETGMEIEAEPFPAQVTFSGRPFALTDPRKTDNHSIISLRGGEHGAKLPAEAKEIKVGKKADRLWFLQAAGWAPQHPNEVVAKYVIHYEDGTESVFPVRFGIEVGDYWVPEPLGAASVAWTGRNLVHSPVGIFCAEWTNPSPEKVIASIDVIGNLVSTQFVVVAISGGVIKNAGPRAKTVSEWQFGEYTDGVVANRIPGGGVLKASESAPTRDKAGLKFENGQSLEGETKAIPELAGFGKEPFAVRVTLSPSAKPSGYCGGLFQAMGYGKNGFRLVLGGDMKVGADVFTASGATGISSRAVLEIGRTYAVELRFDGTYATLMIDGQTDTMKEMALPAPYDGPVQIGVAAGKDYFYNGTITSISVSKLPVEH